MERTVRAGEGQAYAVAVASLWERIGSVLVRLERIADSPPDIVESDLLEELPGLQYRLHSGAELAVGIDPPPAAAAPTPTSSALSPRRATRPPRWRARSRPATPS